MLLHALIVCVALSVVSARSHPDTIPVRARGGKVYDDAVRALNDRQRLTAQYQNMTVNWFDQLLSHGDPSLGTFRQRYWVDYSALNSNIAILYINGEGPANGSPTGYLAEYGHSISAALFGLEHRFYGASLPAPLTNTTMLRYLTVENAMADLEAFRIFAETELLKRTMRWIIVGGSYSGALSAWMKEVYPNSYVASWSSSGVVNARFDYYEFDGHVMSVLPNVCAQTIQQVFSMFSAAYDDPAQRPAMMAKFGTPEYFSKADMAWMLADGSAMAVQYGHKDFLCDSIVPLSADPFTQYATIIKALWGQSFTSSCYYSTECLSNPKYSSQWAGAGYAWVWQCCSQLAYWQTSYPNSLRLSVITTDYYINQCRSAFDPSIFPDTYSFNTKFGGANPKATNVIALQGSDDPWRTAGVQQSLGPAYPMVLAQCNDCGHCGDLMSPSPLDPASLVAQRQQIVSYLGQWLNL